MEAVRSSETSQQAQKAVTLTSSAVKTRKLQAESFLACQEIPRILRKPFVSYIVKKDPALANILSQMNPVHHVSCYCLRPLLILSSGQSLRRPVCL